MDCWPERDEYADWGIITIEISLAAGIAILFSSDLASLVANIFVYPRADPMTTVAGRL